MPRRKLIPPAVVHILAPFGKEWFGVDELELLTGISKWTWRRRAQTGQIASAKFGTRLLISRTEVDRIMAEATRPRKSEQVSETGARTARTA